MDKKMLVVIAVGGILAIVVAFVVVNFIIRPKAEQMLATPLLTDGASVDSESYDQDEKPVPFSEKYRVPVEQMTTNPIDSPESYFQVTIGIIVNDTKLQEELATESAQSMIRAILLRTLNSKKLEDVDTPEEKEELRTELDKGIRKMINRHLGSDVWDKEGYKMEIELVEFLIAV